MEKPFSKMLINHVDGLISQHFENELKDVIGKETDSEEICIDDVTRALDTINDLRTLRKALVDGETRTLFTRHRNALQMLFEKTLDMES